MSDWRLKEECILRFVSLSLHQYTRHSITPPLCQGIRQWAAWKDAYISLTMECLRMDKQVLLCPMSQVWTNIRTVDIFLQITIYSQFSPSTGNAITVKKVKLVSAMDLAEAERSKTNSHEVNWNKTRSFAIDFQLYPLNIHRGIDRKNDVKRRKQLPYNDIVRIIFSIADVLLKYIFLGNFFSSSPAVSSFPGVQGQTDRR